jgi:hypothetical protein
MAPRDGVPARGTTVTELIKRIACGSQRRWRRRAVGNHVSRGVVLARDVTGGRLGCSVLGTKEIGARACRPVGPEPLRRPHLMAIGRRSVVAPRYQDARCQQQHLKYRPALATAHLDRGLPCGSDGRPMSVSAPGELAAHHWIGPGMTRSLMVLCPVRPPLSFALNVTR